MRRGYTLVEVMTVVVIMGVLATLGGYYFKRYQAGAKISEAKSVLSAIASAQEEYRSEHATYLNVSSSLTNYYPPGTPSDTKIFAFRGWTGHSDYATWERLAPRIKSPVRFGYAVVAGLPDPTGGNPMPDPPGRVQQPAAPVEPWYIAQAAGDLDGDGTFSYFTIASINTSQVGTIQILSDDEYE